jgi:hypothetical protein
MTVMETAADDAFVGLDAGAESRLPARVVDMRARLGNAAVVAILVGVQIAWLAVFVYAAYLFLG